MISKTYRKLITLFVITQACCYSFSVEAPPPVEFVLNSEQPHSPSKLFFYNGEDDASVTTFPDQSFYFAHYGKPFLVYSDASDTITTASELEIDGDVILTDLGDNIKYGDRAQWKLFYYEDFQEARAGWSKQTVSSCGTSNNLFLGGHCNFAKDVAKKSFADLPNHSMVSLLCLRI
jgi:hypothetical protein